MSVILYTCYEFEPISFEDVQIPCHVMSVSINLKTSVWSTEAVCLSPASTEAIRALNANQTACQDAQYRPGHCPKMWTTSFRTGKNVVLEFIFSFVILFPAEDTFVMLPLIYQTGTSNWPNKTIINQTGQPFWYQTLPSLNIPTYLVPLSTLHFYLFIVQQPMGCRGILEDMVACLFPW